MLLKESSCEIVKEPMQCDSGIMELETNAEATGNMKLVKWLYPVQGCFWSSDSAQCTAIKKR